MFKRSAAQGKDTYGFLPLHPFLPLAHRAFLRSPRQEHLRPSRLRLADKNTGSACVHEMEGVQSLP